MLDLIVFPATFYVNDMNLNKLTVTSTGNALNLTIWFENSGIEIKVTLSGHQSIFI